MRRKLKDTGGLTLLEMLCATAILVLLCLMMNTGLNMAVKSYRAITAESEAQLLVSSLSDTLADKLRYCVVTEKKADDGTLTYPWSIGEVGLDGGQIVVKVKVKEMNPATGVEEEVEKNEALLPNGAYGVYGQFRAGYIGKYTVGQDGSTPLVAYNPASNSFEVKFIVRDEQLKIERTAEFTVRCLNPVKKEVDTP